MHSKRNIPAFFSLANNLGGLERHHFPMRQGFEAGFCRRSCGTIHWPCRGTLSFLDQRSPYASLHNDTFRPGRPNNSIIECIHTNAEKKKKRKEKSEKKKKPKKFTPSLCALGPPMHQATHPPSKTKPYSRRQTYDNEGVSPPLPPPDTPAFIKLRQLSVISLYPHFRHY